MTARRSRKAPSPRATKPSSPAAPQVRVRDGSVREDPLIEHKAALAKIDGAVALASSKAGDALVCKRGCASCCVDGLSVLPVEAALIEESGLMPPPVSAAGACAFLDEDGACSIYPVRPVLCRTHGLALRTSAGGDDVNEGAPRAGLRVLGEVSACGLNYTARAPRADEVLDAGAVLALLVTVDRRYRKRVGLPDDTSRVPLRVLAARSR